MDGSETLERAIEIAVRAHAGQLYPAYVEALAPNPLARQVKLADLADNLATNLAMPSTPANEARIARYEAAIAALSALPTPDGG